MNIVIAPDSFKGSLTAKEVGLAVAAGVKRALPESVATVIPMADGGEGTMQCLIDATGGRFVEAVVKNPLGRDIKSGFGILGDGSTCVIEVAMSSGLYLIDKQERNPLLTSTYGFGQLIAAALDQGCRKFILGLGGSATNDGGAGMLQALGADLLDEEGNPLGFGGGQLGRLAHIRTSGLDSRLVESSFVVACDVDNPFVGPSGASEVFGPQKGASPDMVRELDEGLRRFADVIEQTRGISIHNMPGTGAAGGLSGGIVAFMNGKLESGVSIVIRETGLEAAIAKADLVITGEGQVDFQTARGKTPCGVAHVARSYNVPVVILAGSVGKGIESLYEHGVSAVLSIVNRPMTLDEAMAQAGPLLEQAAEQAIRIYRIKL
ncbi:glycerate kinase [Gordoniibacillus kamchatkensis]|uniref:Glycerate kinase n=1 Tax=Gordoniibacillus kamchatkensis TaxID=1590651 RepID=A0ABR5AHQ1_9BACL|nr:glycerate kinase [Paenibacillus sp. VKM B-2647]KIL40105.1 glycerate kinase [Paenibacillus sp. VKM B-2647]